MANVTIQLSFISEANNDSTRRLKSKYYVNCFLLNQVDANDQPLKRGLYQPKINLDDGILYPLGQVNENDKVVELEIWIDDKKPISRTSESKIVKIPLSSYKTNKYNTVRILIEEKYNPAGQLMRIVQPGWPKTV